MSIRCGKCYDRHETVQQVRDCYGVRVQPDGSTASTESPLATPKRVSFITDLLRKAHAELREGTPADVLNSEAAKIIDGLLDHLNKHRPLPGWARPIQQRTGQFPVESPRLPGQVMLNAQQTVAQSAMIHPDWSPEIHLAYLDQEGLGDDVTLELVRGWLGTRPRRVRPRKPESRPEPLPDIPEGGYALPSETGKNDLDFFWVLKKTEGRWKGYTFIERVIGGRPNVRLPKDTQIEVRRRIGALSEDEQDDAGILFGQEIGHCYFCKHHLTDRVSRYSGRGPKCSADRGIPMISPPADWKPELTDAKLRRT